jgi:hypothetical protein
LYESKGCFPLCVNRISDSVSNNQQPARHLPGKNKTYEKIYSNHCNCLWFYNYTSTRQEFCTDLSEYVLPKGAIDLEFWHTSRFGHTGQFYNAQDQRMELEFGLGKNWQTAFYFNRYQERYSTTPDETTTSNEIGFSMNGK